MSLKSRFVDKGYIGEEMDKIITDVGNMDRSTTLGGAGINKKANVKDYNFSFVMK